MSLPVNISSPSGPLNTKFPDFPKLSTRPFESLYPGISTLILLSPSVVTTVSATPRELTLSSICCLVFSSCSLVTLSCCISINTETPPCKSRPFVITLSKDLNSYPPRIKPLNPAKAKNPITATIKTNSTELLLFFFMLIPSTYYVFASLVNLILFVLKLSFIY